MTVPPSVILRLLGAAAAGAAAELAGLGLIATAAWLITRAAEQPPLTALTVAIVGVRAFAVSRGTLRYGEPFIRTRRAHRANRDLPHGCRITAPAPWHGAPAVPDRPLR